MPFAVLLNREGNFDAAGLGDKRPFGYKLQIDEIQHRPLDLS
jgi:hypothetical protein